MKKTLVIPALVASLALTWLSGASSRAAQIPSRGHDQPVARSGGASPRFHRRVRRPWLPRRGVLSQRRTLCHAGGSGYRRCGCHGFPRVSLAPGRRQAEWRARRNRLMRTGCGADTAGVSVQVGRRRDNRHGNLGGPQGAGQRMRVHLRPHGHHAEGRSRLVRRRAAYDLHPRCLASRRALATNELLIVRVTIPNAGVSGALVSRPVPRGQRSLSTRARSCCDHARCKEADWPESDAVHSRSSPGSCWPHARGRPLHHQPHRRLLRRRVWDG